MRSRYGATARRTVVAALIMLGALVVPAQALGVGAPLTSALWTKDPDIWGNRVIYSQKNLNQQWRIYIYNLSTHKAVALSAAQIESLYPSLHGTRGSWMESSLALGQSNVVLMDVVGLRQWIPSAPWPGDVVTACDNNDRFVIFRMAMDNGLFSPLKETDLLYDTTVSGMAAYKVLTPAGYESGSDYDRPSLSDRWAVWSARQGAGAENIFYMNLNSSTFSQLSNVPAGSRAVGSVVDGDIAVWQQAEGSYWQVWMANLSTGVKTQLTSGTHSHFQPYVAGQTIVYTDGAKGDSDWELTLYDVATGSSRRLTNDRRNQGNASVYGTRIVWNDWRGDASMSRVYTTTVPKARMTLSAQRGSGSATLTGRALSIDNLPFRNVTVTLQKSTTGRSWSTLTTVKTTSTGGFSYRVKARLYVRAVYASPRGKLVSQKVSTK